MSILLAKAFTTVDPMLTSAIVNESRPEIITLQMSVAMQGTTGWDTTLAGVHVQTQQVDPSSPSDQTVIELDLDRRVYSDDSPFTVTYSPGDWTDQRVPPVPLQALSFPVTNNTITASNAPELDVAASYVHAQEPTIIVLDLGESVTVATPSPIADSGITVNLDASPDTLVSLASYEGDDHKLRVEISTAVVAQAVTVDIAISNTISSATSPAVMAAQATGAVIQKIGF